MDPIRISVEGNTDAKSTGSHFLRNVLITAGIVVVLCGIVYMVRTVRNFQQHKTC